ncbi:galactokinase family protein [Nesterenkonia sp. NBAIMH1]|uniref:galactokinase n=1 Tax=Nesterenkonia sp. NBAIMH1 TaxID=2600320 RepID=UPI0011B35AF8|nr:galactokinase family protein [Nesterenkonia sp. NBAIMH1]
MNDAPPRWLAPGEPASIAQNLRARFSEEFGTDPEGIWFAPGRANLNGEHIDFHGGRCLPLALPHGTYAAARARNDGVLRVRTLEASLDQGVHEVTISAVGPADAEGQDQYPGWTRYVSGVLWALQRADDEDLRPDPQFGADLLIRSTLPVGGGLSSSASLECAAALAFVGLGSALGRDNPGTMLTDALTDAHRADVAAACMRAEVEVVGAGTGGLDQTTSLRAAEGMLLSLDCRDFSLQRVAISFLLRGHRLIAVDTDTPHALSDGEFGSRRADSEAAAAVLGVERLRDALSHRARRAEVDDVLARFDELTAGQDQIQGRPVDGCRRRLKHALSEMVRSEKLNHHFTGECHGVTQMAGELGEVMTAGHSSMRSNAQVSFPLADSVVEAALGAGAQGARLIGGGFGGSVLIMAPEAAVDKITRSVGRLSRGIRFLEVTPSGPARALWPAT